MSVNDAISTVPFAWAGFSLDIPKTWEVVALEKDFVRFENDRGPRLECRWQHTEGSYRLDKRLTKAASQVKHAATIRTESDDTPLPSAFTNAMETLAERGFQARTFAWTDRKADAPHPGALLHDAESDTAVMLRAFPAQLPGDDEELAATLTTARCHPASEERPWAVFGMRVLLPGRLVLKSFSFKPGQYKLEFIGGKHTRLSLMRLGPASMILNGASLTDWAYKYFKGLNLRAARETEPGNGWIILEKPWPQGIYRKISRALPGILRSKSFRLALALADEESKILAVRMEGPTPLTDDEFTKVCTSYEII